jgi:hypothetical protein
MDEHHQAKRVELSLSGEPHIACPYCHAPVTRTEPNGHSINKSTPLKNYYGIGSGKSICYKLTKCYATGTVMSGDMKWYG